MKNKLLLFFFTLSFPLNSMEICSCLKVLSRETKKKLLPKKSISQKKYLWIKTNDNHIIVCNKPIIIESAWFIVAYEENLFRHLYPVYNCGRCSGMQLRWTHCHRLSWNRMAWYSKAWWSCFIRAMAKIGNSLVRSFGDIRFQRVEGLKSN